MFGRLFGTKTFWAVITALTAALQQYTTGRITLQQAIQMVIPALLALFLRDGIAKAQATKS